MIAITVDHVFNLINLLVRLGLIIYIVKKYIIGSITTSIYLEKQDLINLQNRQNLLVDKQRKVLLQIKQDQQIFDTLHAKFQIWDEKVQKKLIKDQQTCQARQDAIFKAGSARAEYLQKQTLIQHQVPELLNQVTQHLQDQFAKDPLLSKKFNQKLLQTLHVSEHSDKSGLHG